MVNGLTDPVKSILEDKGTPILEAAGVAPDAGSVWRQRFWSLILPCSENPLAAKGIVSNNVNNLLSKKSGVEPGKITVGENLAHCINHLLPGVGGAGMPPIVSLGLSWMDFQKRRNELAVPEDVRPKP